MKKTYFILSIITNISALLCIFCPDIVKTEPNYILGFILFTLATNYQILGEKNVSR